MVIELEALHTLPEHERKGAGTALMEWGIRLADSEGLPIRLLSSPHGFELYRRFGFVELGRVTVDLARWGGEGEFTWYLMNRGPKAVE
jgi:GNAT superfamily N-acetyltransferase